MCVGRLLLVISLFSYLFTFGTVYGQVPKPCCNCKTGCNSSCICGCKCDNATPGKVCLKSLNQKDLQATFTKETPDGESFTIPIADMNTLTGIQPGDCGLISMETVKVCDQFVKEPGQAQQSTDEPTNRMQQRQSLQ
jgi:hypothetical protein